MLFGKILDGKNESDLAAFCSLFSVFKAIADN